MTTFLEQVKLQGDKYMYTYENAHIVAFRTKVVALKTIQKHKLSDERKCEKNVTQCYAYDVSYFPKVHPTTCFRLI